MTTTATPVRQLTRPTGWFGALTSTDHKRIGLNLGLAALTFFTAVGLGAAEKPYPLARHTDQTDSYHGTIVADPFRWLEDDNSAETKAWVEAQNKVTFAYLAQIPERARIKERLTKLWNYERFGVPFKEGGRYFFTKNDGLQNQGVLYTLRSLDAAPQVLLDPNLFSTDGPDCVSAIL